MLKIGLTGGIGSGKSIVAQIFEVLGIPVFYADSEAKQIMETDSDLVSAITKTFGFESYVEGRLNRAYIAKIVFNDSFRLDQLNALVHPATIAAAEQWMNQQNAPYVIKEAALLFESGSGAHLDYIVGVYAPQHIRIKRVMDRDALTREDIMTRMSRQISEVIKMKLCDYTINNDEQQLLIPQVMSLHEKFIEMAARSSG
jgi:dephospho-CoA kinase